MVSSVTAQDERSNLYPVAFACVLDSGQKHSMLEVYGQELFRCFFMLTRSVNRFIEVVLEYTQVVQCCVKG